MITPSTLEIGTEVGSRNRTHRPESLLRTFARSLTKSRSEKGIRSSKPSFRTAQSYRLGEVVHHGKFGTGQVMVHWPDGTLLVRFDGAVKSRLVWPSLLDRMNDQRR